MQFYCPAEGIVEPTASEIPNSMTASDVDGIKE